MTKTSQPVHLYNTFSRSLETLRAADAKPIGVYCCGPTVYNFQHIGNLRTYIFEDILVRTLRFAGYQVRHVMNITDVGHLVSDADDGEDKMLTAVKREGKRSEDIAAHYTSIFFEHCALLNIRKPDVVCEATTHIAEMIDLIQRLEKKDVAYKSGGNVYFDVSRFPEYGKLAKLDLESLKAGARIEVDSNKRHPLDFALWFTKSKFENQELQWDSPWGRGYPGWHIECSAMAMKYLGEHFDIHCGGIDHIPVHHTNEIAQSEAATGTRLADIWMHGAFLLTGKDKMSKSSGEFLTLDKIREKGFDPLTYRLFCYNAHYRQELTWSWQALESTSASLERIRNHVLDLKAECEGNTLPKEISSPGATALEQEFTTAVLDDLSTPRALASFYSALNEKSLDSLEKLSLLYRFDQVLGLGLNTWENETVEVPAEVQRLIELRKTARDQKNWKESDRIRDDIAALGFVVTDSKDGQAIKPR